MMREAHPHAVEGDVAAFNQHSQGSGEQRAGQKLMCCSSQLLKADPGQIRICGVERIEARKDR